MEKRKPDRCRHRGCCRPPTHLIVRSLVGVRVAISVCGDHQRWAKDLLDTFKGTHVDLQVHGREKAIRWVEL
jgi:hypothetical protein